ncbi:uncharacterized protein LAESUDRAFT_739680 [Laetiporus sulphureus 93-53]|uniref:J domain-containing protein n=1 Tax=Laetiporus sulphureus 93-53 TaxID=1314785 RepID=A0A165B627_9APHY|nr:uncharacterized protein LAESUDRAFT_739680 [Laetiporus sulphureus 93-53]KZT00322.1 hypothetical protein LAESUDRAFT_739680 [Laetiporus sulphureus 93-53]
MCLPPASAHARIPDHRRRLRPISNISGVNASKSSDSTSSQNQMPCRGRKIGIQEKLLETKYYDILGIPVDVTTDNIKKAYHSPHAEECFKKIAIAYQTLSDPELRWKYNEFRAKESMPEGEFVDPEEVFGTIFGGERFVPIIRHISLVKDMKAALQEADEMEDEENGKQKAAVRAEWVQKLVQNLERKLGIFTESAMGPDDRQVT